MNIPIWLSSIFTGVAGPAIENAEKIAIKKGLQFMHDNHLEEYTAGIAVETAEIKKLEALVANSSELVKSIVATFAQAFTESAQENGVTLTTEPATA